MKKDGRKAEEEPKQGQKKLAPFGKFGTPCIFLGVLLVRIYGRQGVPVFLNS